MYKDKRIKFKQVNEQEIKIFLEYEDFKKGGGFETKEKEIGHIFSPAGSGNNVSNAIQVCGLSGAYDYWGCGNFGKPKVIPNGNEFTIGKSYYYDSKGNKIMEQVKDIQLYFAEDTQKCSLDTLDDCDRCFNTDCSCEIKQDTNLLKEEFGNKAPFTVKRFNDIPQLILVKNRKNGKIDYRK